MRNPKNWLLTIVDRKGMLLFLAEEPFLSQLAAFLDRLVAAASGTLGIPSFYAS